MRMANEQTNVSMFSMPKAEFESQRIGMECGKAYRTLNSSDKSHANARELVIQIYRGVFITPRMRFIS